MLRFILILYIIFIIIITYLYYYNSKYIIGQDRMMQVSDKYEYTNYFIGRFTLERSHNDLYNYIVSKYTH